MSKSPRKTLEHVFLDAIADGGTGGSMEDVVSKAAAEIKEAVLAAVGEDLKESNYVLNMGTKHNPPSNTTRTNLVRQGANLTKADIRKAILTMFEGE